MAKKKTQFNKAKFNKKSGVLSYNYLGGEAGKGKGAVSIVKQDGDWYFADKSGKIRTDVGINGKLTPTHMSNLERDGIFAAAEINNKGERLSKAEIKDAKANIGGDRSSDTISKGSGPNPRDNIPTTSGNEINRPGENLNLEETNYQLAPTNAVRPEMGVSDNKAFTKAPVAPTRTSAGSSFSDMANPASIPTDPRQGDYGSTFQNWEGAGQMSLPNNNVITPNVPIEQHRQGVMGEWADKGYATEAAALEGSAKFHQPGSAGNFQQYTGGQTNFRGLDAASAPGLNTGTLDIGKGGEGVTQWGGDDAFYRTKDGTLMKDSGWFGGDDTVATQADIDAGIKDQASPGMTSAEGWQAAGSIMKGVGGLASAYTGIKNYQLARDAFNTQKNQWQADYDQRLKAYEDNKQLANQDIEARNRTLQARGQAANQYSKLS